MNRFMPFAVEAICVRKSRMGLRRYVALVFQPARSSEPDDVKFGPAVRHFDDCCFQSVCDTASRRQTRGSYPRLRTGQSAFARASLSCQNCSACR